MSCESAGLIPRLPLLFPFLQCTWLSPRRWLNLQEYQSKKLMQNSGVAVQRFYVADTASEALEAAKRLSEYRRQTCTQRKGHAVHHFPICPPRLHIHNNCKMREITKKYLINENGSCSFI